VLREHFQFCGIWTKTFQEGIPFGVINSREDIKVVENLGGKTV
jgi:hypothetical protein